MSTLGFVAAEYLKGKKTAKCNFMCVNAYYIDINDNEIIDCDGTRQTRFCEHRI